MILFATQRTCGGVIDEYQINFSGGDNGAYLVRVGVAAIAVDVGVVGEQRVEGNTRVVSDGAAELPGEDLVDRRAVLTRDSQAKRLKQKHV